MLRAPVEPFVAPPKREARAVVAKQRTPAAFLTARDITLPFAQQDRTVQVVVPIDQLVSARELAGIDQFQMHRLEQMLLRGIWGNRATHCRSNNPKAC